jgi:hypothetical protein
VTAFDHIAVLRRAREIVEAGGDPAPCALGTFCLRCCAAMAKGQLDGHGTSLADLADVIAGQIRLRDDDQPLAMLDQLVAEQTGATP